MYASCADELKSSELYRNDLIEFVSYYVAAKAENFYKQALKDDSENRVLAAQRNLQQTVDLLMDVDRLLASHPLISIRRMGGTCAAIAEQLFRKKMLMSKCQTLDYKLGWYPGGLCRPFLERTD